VYFLNSLFNNPFLLLDVPVQVQLEGVGDNSTNVTPLSTAALTSPLKDHIDGHSTMEGG
jgi:hypothetical protein